MADSTSQPVQLELKRGLNKKDEDDLIDAYHDNEALGDTFSTASKSVMDHETAISHYDNAVRERSKANKMHIAPDAGHLKAIKWIEGKITSRRNTIEELNKATENKKRQAAALARRDAGPAATGEPALPRHLA